MLSGLLAVNCSIELVCSLGRAHPPVGGTVDDDVPGRAEGKGGPVPPEIGNLRQELPYRGAGQRRHLHQNLCNGFVVGRKCLSAKQSALSAKPCHAETPIIIFIVTALVNTVSMVFVFVMIAEGNRPSLLCFISHAEVQLNGNVV